ncbi:MAG TPA: immunoglobulin domain-containing protein, partial [Bacillota bacterium]|nr:immunoglobulin domain-containing protein [Bacillota bacterium]
GSTVTLSVGASGTAPLSYQWRRGTNLLADGGNISGATTASLTLSSVSHADETNGKYSVVVSGAGAPVTSSSVSLSVDDPPAITAQPIGQTNSAGDFIKFTVSATGGDLAYQWRFNGLPLAGATKSSLSRTNVQAASAGIYSVEVTNVAGSVISADAVLALVGTNSSRIALWDFNSEPADNKSSTGLSTPGAGSGTATLVGGATADFRDGASSDLASLGNDNSAWELTDFPAQGTSNKLAGAQFAVSTLNYQHLIIGWQMHVTKGASKFYRFQYTTDGANFLDGELITVPVYNQFFYQAIDLSGIPEVNNNPNFGFRIVAEFESTALGSTNENYVTPSTSSYSSSSDLTLDMINIFGTLGTFPPPNILTQPQSCTNLAHSTATFSVRATTTDRLSYQWCKNGEALDDGGNVSGAATSTLTLADVSLADAADYTVVLTNGGGSVTSAVAQLTVLVPVVPVISSQPVNRTNEAGTTVVFTVLAANADSYQWFKGTTPLSDGGTISGAQTATLTILGAQPSDEGDYSVLISNASGSVSSAAAFLKVLLRQVPAPRIQSIQSAEGGQVTLTWSAESGATYRVQYKDQLDQAGWADLASEVVATGSTTSFTDTPGSTPRFYRILVVR